MGTADDFDEEDMIEMGRFNEEEELEGQYQSHSVEHQRQDEGLLRPSVIEVDSPRFATKQ